MSNDTKTAGQGVTAPVQVPVLVNPAPLSLFELAGMNVEHNRLFKSTPLKTGTRYSRPKRTELAQTFGLVGKENADLLTEKLQQLGKGSWVAMRAALTVLEDYELLALSETQAKSGERVIALRIREIIDRVDVPKLARQLGKTEDEVRAMLAAAKAERMARLDAITVPSTTTTVPTPQITDKPKDEGKPKDVTPPAIPTAPAAAKK